MKGFCVSTHDVYTLRVSVLQVCANASCLNIIYKITVLGNINGKAGEEPVVSIKGRQYHKDE